MLSVGWGRMALVGVIGATLPSPVGTVLVVQREDAVAAVHLGAEGPLPVRLGESALLSEAVAQLRAYFAGELRVFDLPVQTEGTAFQQRVWAHLRTIPWGTTRTYAAVAAALGLRLGAARAVGAANGANPVAIIVPCHRVIGADGSLTGYAGGVERKRALLRLEGSWSPTEQPALF